MMAKAKNVTIVANRDLLIKEEYIGEEDNLYREFNEAFNEFCDLNDRGTLDKVETKRKVEVLKKAAFSIVFDFDFQKEAIKDKTAEYIFFARDAIYWLAHKPTCDAESTMLLVRILYGQTNVGYIHNDENKAKMISDGNEWVEYLEKHTDNKTLKSYAATLRAFQYLANGELLEMSIEERLTKTERELKYAICWDTSNYLAYYALGLLYSDDANDKYNKDLAIENFNKVLEYQDRDTELDKYLIHGEKEKAIDKSNEKKLLLEF